ncbi:MAG: radical SAM protein, partial [Candidatus Heimdallarchaeota archaeon]|nr:radical SAM protein [Candidatus Heimdallarchaeota archaeon]
IKGLWYRADEEVLSNERAENIADLGDLPMPAWDLLPMDKYRAHNWHCFDHINERSPYAIIYTSLGCPFNCEYCNIHALYSGKPGIRFRSSQKVVEELDYLVKNYNIKNVKFLDELFVLNKDRLDELCDLLIQRDYDLNIWAYARIDTVDKEGLSKLRKAGIRWLCYGIEAGSKEVRVGVNKGRFDQEAIKRAVKMTQDAGIYVLGNFMFGLPDDNLETMQETLDLSKELNCDYVNFYTTMAYPGSRLYDKMVEQGVELPDDWRGFSQYSEQTLPLPTKYLSAEEVLRFRDNAFDEYYNDPGYHKLLEDKFGKETLEHVKQMVRHKIHRNILK